MKKYIKATGLIVILFGVILLNSTKMFSQKNNQLKNKYLIVLDMQTAYTQNIPNEQIDFVNKIIENTVPEKVIYIKNISYVLNSTSKGIKKDTAENLEIDKRIKIVSDNIFCKEKGNAFTSLELTEFIEKNKAEDFVVIGLMAEYCLYNTVCGGLNLDYKISVIPNAVFGKSEGGKTKYLDKMYKKGAKKLDFE